MRRKYLIAALLALTLVACESYSPSKQDIGMETGAILGGVVGHQIGHGAGQTVATIGGAALGAFFGSKIGAKMDRNDQLKTAQALETSKNSEPTSWRNPDTGQRYTVTPTRTYEGPSGPCREFSTVADINSQRELVHGTACRQADGTWKTT
ncbi:MAG: RT0821/Lpp0805 family surface protein [Burkholderiales bacterium]